MMDNNLDSINVDYLFTNYQKIFNYVNTYISLWWYLHE